MPGKAGKGKHGKGNSGGGGYVPPPPPPPDPEPPPPTPPPPPTFNRLLIDGFEAIQNRIAINNPAFPKEYNFFNIYDGTGTISLSTEKKFSGAQSLKIDWTNPIISGAYYLGQPLQSVSFDPRCGWASRIPNCIYPRDNALGLLATPYTNDYYNAMRFRVFLPSQWHEFLGDAAVFQSVELGTFSVNTTNYFACNTDSFESISPEYGRGMHWYHFLRMNKNSERWTTCVIHWHPQHMRETLPGVELGLKQYPSLEAGWNYLDSMPRFYWDVRPPALAVADGSPIFFFDDFEYLSLPYTEDWMNVCNTSGSYRPSDNLVYASWNRSKNTDARLDRFDIRYSKDTSVHIIGWDAATPAPSGTNLPSIVDDDVRTLCEYGNTGIDVTGCTTLYLAVKKVGEANFTEIEISVTV